MVLVPKRKVHYSKSKREGWVDVVTRYITEHQGRDHNPIP